MPVAITIAALVIIAIVFHLISPWWQTPIASNWGSIDSALNITLWICGIAFVVLNLFLAYCIYRFRHRPGHRAHYEPENPGLEKQLTLWTAVGIVGMLAPGLAAWSKYVTVPDDVAIVEAVGQQWNWSYRYPGPDNVLGMAAVKYMTPENPMGINPTDPFGRDDVIVEAGEMHLPVNRPVKVVLRSKDVLHDFYVPEFRAKMDLVPGIVTYFWMTPTKEGPFDILCAELCGVGHHEMRGTVVVQSAADFDRWLAGQESFGDQLASADPVALSRLFALADFCTAPTEGSSR